jgi:hypothetical protein
MSLGLRVLRETLGGIRPAPRQPLGIVHLRFVGLYDDHWTIAIRAPQVTVEHGPPPTAGVQLFCSKAQLDALVAGEIGVQPLRYVGSKELLEHLASLLTSAKSLLSLRASHQAKHYAEHFREELEGQKP